GHRRERTSVKRSERRQNLETSVAPSPRELDSGLIRLGARVAQEDFSVAEMIRQLLDQSRCRLGVEDVGNVRELLSLLLDRAHDAGIPVTEAGDREPAEKIEIAVAVGVVQVR